MGVGRGWEVGSRRAGGGVRRGIDQSAQAHVPERHRYPQGVCTWGRGNFMSIDSQAGPRPAGTIGVTCSQRLSRSIANSIIVDCNEMRKR